MQKPWELRVDEAEEGGEDVRGLLLSLPLLEEGLVGRFEVQCHRTEAGPFKVEIEVLVVLSAVTLLRFLWGGGYSLLTAFRFFHSHVGFLGACTGPRLFHHCGGCTGNFPSLLDVQLA